MQKHTKHQAVVVERSMEALILVKCAGAVSIIQIRFRCRSIVPNAASDHRAIDTTFIAPRQPPYRRFDVRCFPHSSSLPTLLCQSSALIRTQCYLQSVVAQHLRDLLVYLSASSHQRLDSNRSVRFLGSSFPTYLVFNWSFVSSVSSFTRFS